MIYFTKFILALFLSQIARAVPQACGDIIPPESPTPVEQFNLPIPEPTVVTLNNKYDNRDGLLKNTTCSNFYPPCYKFSNIPTFPHIGGAFDIPSVNCDAFDDQPSSNCSECWLLTNSENDHSVIITVIDHADHGFDISDAAFKMLNLTCGDQVEYRTVPKAACGLY
jgi:hypothetical protein